MPSKTAVELTQERRSTHGSYPEMSRVLMNILRAAQDSPNWATLPDSVQVFVLNNAQKLSRILTGNPYEPDHYADVAGYAYLAEQDVAPAAPTEEVTGSASSPRSGSSVSAGESPFLGSTINVVINTGAVVTDEQSEILMNEARNLVKKLVDASLSTDPDPAATEPTSPAAAAPTSEAGDAGPVPLDAAATADSPATAGPTEPPSAEPLQAEPAPVLAEAEVAPPEPSPTPSVAPPSPATPAPRRGFGR